MHDCAVVGAGPAGVAASVFLKRAGFDVILFERGDVGGLLWNAHRVENYPGFPDGISGPEFCGLLEEHISKWDVALHREEVKHLRETQGGFLLFTDTGNYKCKTIIMATGSRPKHIGIPGEKELAGWLVFHEVKDLRPMVKPGTVVSVIGGGDAAFDYALNLAEHGAIIELCHRGERPKCLPLLEKRVAESPSIHVHSDSEPLDISDLGGRPGVMIRHPYNDGKTITYRENRVAPNYVLIACGRGPEDTIVPEGWQDPEKPKPGLYLAGDLVEGRFRQAGIAVGDGIRAAMSVEEHLRCGKEQKHQGPEQLEPDGHEHGQGPKEQGT